MLDTDTSCQSTPDAADTPDTPDATCDAPDADHQRQRLLLLVTPSTYRAAAFVEAARRLDVEIVRGLDLPASLAEQWNVQLAADFTNADAATQAILAYVAAHPVDAIIAVDDSATLIAARAAATLGLPHNPPEAAEAARDKGLMRALMSAAGVPCPVFRRFPLASDPAEIARQVTYPCVVKPLRLSGSRGVIRADDADEFVAAFVRLKRLLLGDGYPLATTDILVEDFIPGVEVALEGLLTDGELHTLAIFDKPDPLDGPFFEETIYTTPSRLSDETQAAIADCVARAAASIGLRDGPTHAEVRVNERGPWMVEIAGRSIGGLCSTILEFGAGMRLEEIILRNALRLPLPTLDRSGPGAGVMMIPIPKSGMLRSVAGVEQASATPNVTGVEITIKPHTQVTGLPEGNSYLGFIFARADDPATAEAALRAAHAELRFDIRPVIALVG
ncbi:MAG TPA: ATP-grasp domain-containing protein [Ktedonobacterales bacterium]|nr:ATP-grasp domain-containing protein [Ktedonobacterales bacterium]